MHAAAKRPLTARPAAHPTTRQSQGGNVASGLHGEARVPGDKSISHRALLLGASAVGETVIEGLLEGEDILATAAAMRSLGAEVARGEDGTWRVWGVGVGGFAPPADILDMGNSGTGARLLLGLLASAPVTAIVTGDASLRSRPMARVIDPLTEMGAEFSAREGGRLPVTMTGAEMPVPIDYTLPVASAQVKSAILLAGLNTPGDIRVVEPSPTRDHTERMLRHFGATVRVEEDRNGRSITLRGQPELSAQHVVVPADPSSAAFPVVAAVSVPSSSVTLTGVCMNPLRIGLFETLSEMGAVIETNAKRSLSGEPAADLVVRSANLTGIEVPEDRVPSMIDEFPILAIAAACATGRTVFRGVGELRVKESDRLSAVAEGLRACGVTVEDGPDWMVVEGCAGPPPGPAPGVKIATHMDHRIAMSFLVLGLAARQPVTVDDGGMIDTSFPGFVDLMNGLGGSIGEAGP